MIRAKGAHSYRSRSLAGELGELGLTNTPPPCVCRPSCRNYANYACGRWCVLKSLSYNTRASNSLYAHLECYGYKKVHDSWSSIKPNCGVLRVGQDSLYAPCSWNFPATDICMILAKPRSTPLKRTFWVYFPTLWIVNVSLAIYNDQL
jgi:hypothetical protein